MSKQTCHECENSMYQLMCSNTLCPIDNENFAEQCGGFTQIHKPPKNLFHRITTTPEVLAEKLLYAPLGEFCKLWYSTVLPGEHWNVKAEAIAATVAKLKEVCNG